MTDNILKCLYVHSGNAGDINCCKGIVKKINSEYKILETNEEGDIQNVTLNNALEGELPAKEPIYPKPNSEFISFEDSILFGVFFIRASYTHFVVVGLWEVTLLPTVL